MSFWYYLADLTPYIFQILAMHPRLKSNLVKTAEVALIWTVQWQSSSKRQFTAIVVSIHENQSDGK